MLRLRGTCCLVTLLVSIAPSYGDEAEYRLVKDLLANYDKDVRPVNSIGDALEVRMGLAIMQIIDLDERNQILMSNMWLRLYWRDDHLSWNASDYGGIDTLYLEADRIWKPDITLYNDVSGRRAEVEKFRAGIASDGSVWWLSPLIIKSSCELDVTYFPWDRQFCDLTWGSWSMDGTKLNLFNRSETGDVTSFVPNGEWELVGMPVIRHVVYYGCCPEPYPTLSFEVIIQRKSLYYLTNLILPCAFISACALLVFWLPPESGEKISLSVTVLLAITVFLLLIAETLPTQSKSVPLISTYFLSVLMMLSASVVCTVLVITYHHRGDLSEEVPPWLKTLLLVWLSTITGMRELVKINQDKHDKSKINQVAATDDSKLDEALVLDDIEAPVVNGNIDISLDKKPPVEETLTETRLSKILSILHVFKRRLADVRYEEKLRNDWMLCSQVLDRFFLVLYVIAIVVMHIAVLGNHPN